MNNFKGSLLTILFSFSAVQISQAEVTMAPPPIPAAIKAASKLAKSEDFKLFDSNGDNTITFDEYIKGKELKERKRSEKEFTKVFLECDKNKDGMLSLDELPAEDEMFLDVGVEQYEKNLCKFPKEAMEVVDQNGDKMVSREEVLDTISNSRHPNKKVEDKLEKKALKRAAQGRIKNYTRCDTDSDTLLSMREAFSMKCNLTLFTEQFDAYDSNLDGFLSIEELGAEVKSVPYRTGFDSKMLETRKKMPPLLQLESSMYECDKDSDGRFSKSEAVGVQCEQDMVYFDRVDNNQNGYITQEELDRMRSRKTFDRMDKDKDGVLNLSEFSRSGSAFIE